MAKFKVGDKIECIHIHCSGILTKNKVYEVLELNNHGHPYILTDDNRKDWAHSDNFELIRDWD